MLVPCPFRPDHKIRKGWMHGSGQCPPPRGKHGDRGHSLYPHKVGGRYEAGDQATAGHGVSVPGIHNAGASSPNRGGKKIKITERG